MTALKLNNIETLTIRRSEWLRGEGPDKSYLIRAGDLKKCCIGICLIAMGAAEEHLIGDPSAHNLTWDYPVPEWMQADPGNEADISEMYRVNDSPFLAQVEREAKLTRLFALQGIAVTFVD